MSRYENINTEITDMKELITSINKRFDQTYKKIDILDEKVDQLQKDMNAVIEFLKSDNDKSLLPKKKA